MVAGSGFLVVNDILTDASYQLFEPVVQDIFPTSIGSGSQIVAVADSSIYAGCQLLIGKGANLEVVTVASVTDNSFTATFAFSHDAGDTIVGATFPIQQAVGDPFFTQSEMLGYVATAVNDFLLRCPLAYAVDTSTSIAPTGTVVALPDDCMVPVRIEVAGKGLRETSQANLDAIDYRWQQQAADVPYVYYRDKVGVQKFGAWPQSNVTTPIGIVYQQRGPQTVNLGDGFLLPDPFLVYVKARVLEFAYSKDGEQRSPAMARYFNGRFEMGIKISRMFLEAAMDPNQP